MKLCERCKVSGCYLNYLGVSCANARKWECPDVQPTNGELMWNMEPAELAKFLADWANGSWSDAGITAEEVLEWLNAPA